MMRRWRKYKDPEVAPDEIFLDASNAADFDRSRFEGRLEKPLTTATYASLSVVLGVVFLVLAVQSTNLQVLQGAAFAAQSANNSLETRTLFAPRGIITDRNGFALAENVEREDGTGMRRVYTMPEIGQIIGYVSNPKKDSSGKYYDTSQTGVVGLEAMYDTFLTGTNGKILTETDAYGKIRSEGVVVPAKEGTTLRLSVDAQVEKHLAAAISSTARDKGFIAGGGVVMDVETGEVIAIVSYPSYDPNVMSRGSPADVIAGYNTSPGHPFLDHAIQGIYTPGSVVKPFVAAGALTDGLITENTRINDPGSISISDPYRPGKSYSFKSWKPLGVVDVKKAIAWSSDVFFYSVGGGFENQKGLGIDRLNYWYQQFGFGRATGIDLPGEADGLLPTPEWKLKTLKEQWYLADTYFTAIGQYSMQVTPIQIARATAAVANGGKLLTPSIRKLQVPEKPKFTTVPVSAESLSLVRAGMRLTVTEALAGALNVPYVSVAAKTGTAQTGTRNQYDNSWVEGFFPYDNPKYAFVVVLERGPEGSGSQAVNAMRKFLDLLHRDNSTYVGGSGTVPTSASTTTPT